MVVKRKKISSIVACGLGLLLLVGSVNAEAAMGISDAKRNATSSVKIERQAKSVKSDKAKVEKVEQTNLSSNTNSTEKLDIKERIYRILHPEEFEEKTTASSDLTSDDNMIMGKAVATQEQCVRFLLKHNPYPKLNVSAKELVSYYYEEGNRTGIRPDIAFAQALKETGYFRYGGTVVPSQNNYCGLGTTSATVRGAYFATPRLGVKAHIQHLLAYASTEEPDDEIVDPRYELVRQSYGSQTLTQWKDLNGRWAVPGVGYGQSILEDYYKGILDS